MEKFLTPRQREIMSFVCHGMSAKEIARKLDLSPRTVEVHMVKLRNNIGARNMSHAVAIYLERMEPTWKP